MTRGVIQGRGDLWAELPSHQGPHWGLLLQTCQDGDGMFLGKLLPSPCGEKAAVLYSLGHSTSSPALLSLFLPPHPKLHPSTSHSHPCPTALRSDTRKGSKAVTV